MKFFKILVFFFASFLFLVACEEDPEEPPLLELEGTEWVGYNNNEAVLFFYDTTWLLEVEGANPDLEGTYDFSNPPRIVYYQLDENGDVELVFDGEVVYNNTITFGGDQYIRR